MPQTPHRQSLRFALAALAMMTAAPALAQSAPLTTGPVAASFTPQTQTIPDTSGPYAVVMEMDASLPDHTIYRPADLSAVGRRLPVVAWGVGGCRNVGNVIPGFLAELASYGFLVVSGGPIVPGADAPPSGERPATPPAQNRTVQMLETIDWAIAQNDVTGGAYKDHIDTAKIAVAGHSCGGLQSIAAADDPRVVTAIVGNSGTIRGPLPGPNGTTRDPGYLPSGVDDLKRLTVPMLYVVGGPSDHAYPGATGDFEDITTTSVFFASIDKGHGGTYREPQGGSYATVMRSWLQWRLLDDQEASRMFLGEDCGLCTDPAWTVRTKGY